MLMSDVHYYLGGWEPQYDYSLYICGGMFYPVPGTYVLPCREGHYSIVPGKEHAEVYMTT